MVECSCFTLDGLYIEVSCDVLLLIPPCMHGSMALCNATSLYSVAHTQIALTQIALLKEIADNRSVSYFNIQPSFPLSPSVCRFVYSMNVESQVCTEMEKATPGISEL